MAAAAAVFKSSELVERIIKYLPFKVISKVQRVSRQFRKIIMESPSVHEARCVKPLKLSELRFSNDFSEGPQYQFLTSLMRSQMNNVKVRDQIIFERYYNNRRVDIPQTQFESTPHYSIDSHIIFNNRFSPVNQSNHVNPYSNRAPKPWLPSRIQMTLPDTHDMDIQRFRSEFITEPPITMLEIEAINFWEETKFSSCVLRWERGVTVGDVLDTQKAMLAADPRYWLNYHRGLDEQECYAWVVKNVDQQRVSLLRFESGT